MAQSLISSTNNMIGSFHNNFDNYLSGNNIIVTASAICIGMATKDIIQRFLEEVIHPLLINVGDTKYILIFYQYLIKSTHHLPGTQLAIRMIGITIWLFVAWSIIIFITYILMKFLVKNNYILEELRTINYALSFVTQEENKNKS